MQVPVEWLREYVDWDESLEDIAAKITMAGLEIGEVVDERFGQECSVVGKVTSVEQHPKREDFQVLTVESGDLKKTVLSNLRKFEIGEILPIAYEGFIFPDGAKLEPMKFSGVESDGKILSEADVEYSKDDGVILPLPEGAKVGDCVPDIMGITQKVFKFDLTSNRGDCLCVFGIARDLAAVLNKPLKKNVFDFELPTEPLDIDFSVEIKAPKLCPRYSGRVIRDVKIMESPVWMKRRLAACGMRAINSIVDVTNYVMLETGQPLHAFDLDTLEDRAIVVRKARKNEKITTIDDSQRLLDPFMLVIADRKRPVAVAGVMGGADTEISDKTVNMLIESAHFEPRNLRKTATALEMRTEACIRFEKGVDPTTTASAGDYASFLIQKNGWGRPLDGMIDKNPRPHKPKKIKLNPAKVRGFVAPDITDEMAADILRRLHFEVEVPQKGKTLTVTAPGHRFDMNIWEDLAEEIARIYGYNNIPSEMPRSLVHTSKVTPNLRRNRRLREILVSCGASEIISFSFTNMRDMQKAWPENQPEAVPIKNPLTDDHTYLRPSLIVDMLKTIARNKANSPDTPLQLFELGKIFHSPNRPQEKESLAIGVCGTTLQTPGRTDFKIDTPVFFLIKGLIDKFMAMSTGEDFSVKRIKNPMFHPYRSAEILLNGTKIGEVGEVHPNVLRNFDIREPAALAIFDLDPIKAIMDREPKYSKISRQPALVRDLSVVVDDDIMARDVEAVIRKHGTDLLQDTFVFDVFRGEKLGEGKKSVTFALEFRASDKTLTDEQVAPVMHDIIFYLQDEVGGTLREN